MEPGASLRTHFDSPERSAVEEIEQTASDLAALPLVAAMLEGFPSAAVLLDANRHIVALNSTAMAMFEVMSPSDVHGLRLGEALGCICAHVMDAGCGTSVNCAECGAAHAIRTTRESNAKTVRDCRLTTNHHGVQTSFDLRVFVTPIKIAGHDLRLVGLEDIAAEKRRDVLERIFFHDVLGSANAVQGLAKLVAEAGVAQCGEASDALLRASMQLLDEIQAQRDLVLAERGELTLDGARVEAGEILEAVHAQYCWSPIAKGRELSLRQAPSDCVITSDRTQLVRSLGNLVRNALEAAADGERVTVSAERVADGVLFQVTNPGTIPRNLQVQIFQRSFSTKAPRGRGIGIYSVKLVVEQYLGGRVSFVSTPDTGTVFSIWLPLNMPDEHA